MNSQFIRIFSVLIFLGLTSCQSLLNLNSNSSKTDGVESASSSDKLAAQFPKLIPRGFDLVKAPQKIAFSSCADQDKPQPLWATIEKNKPELYLAMGDNVYASRPETQPIAEQYAKLERIPEYRSFREKTPFMATWDDHDIGVNDGGADAPTKMEAYSAILKHFPYLKDSIPESKNSFGGLYHSKIFGDKKYSVQVIMLDTRSFRSPLKKNPAPEGGYLPDSDQKASMLGETQWSWFEQRLHDKSDIKIIVSSIQLIANDHRFERWGEFPSERERFFSLIQKIKPKNTFIVSGDRHLAAIAHIKLPHYGELYDITASSINKAKFLSENDETYLGSSYGGENFGLALIDWKKRTIKFEIRDLKNEVVNQLDVKLKR